MKKNTYTLAYETCEKLFFESGRIPTIQNIKQIININSPNTISAAIKDWKTAFPKSSHAILRNKGLPLPLLEAATAIWEHALLQANSQIKIQLEDISNQQQSLEAKESELVEEKIRLLHSLQLSEQTHQKEVAQMNAELKRLTFESENQNELTDQLRAMNSGLESEITILNAQLNQEREKLNRLENQYNKEHEWALKRIEEEKNIITHALQKEINRLHTESNRNRKCNELLQAKLDIVIEQANQYKDRISILERDFTEKNAVKKRKTTKINNIKFTL